ncbi:MAG: isoprenylcysteine carboxylmethyltransferase family protein [Beijerinckiaceae bacterium]|nr:isoprenylcysteine carboxylmethyltransferase family protein [Beijerinckiaceae bacterium]
MTRKLWAVIGAEFSLFAGLLFGAAGTADWAAAWVFLFILFGPLVAMASALARSNPALLQERMKPLFQQGQPLWDKIILAGLILLCVLWLILMALDAGRFHWSSMPLWLQCLGGAGILLSMWISACAFRANSFLANVVRIQTERGHKVVTDGPYGVIRHPLYASTLLLFPSAALLLGSWLGVAAASLIGCVIIVRTVLEDRELHRKLEGYAAYARLVPYRLLPKIW